MKSSSCALLALVVALILAGAYYFYTQKDQKDKNSQSSTDQENISENSSADESNSPTVVEPQKIDLTDVSGGEGQGIANRIFSSDKFIHTITAQLKAPDTGSFYAGWLMKLTDGKEDFICSGKFEQSGSDYYLEFRSDKDYSQYNKVVVTLQSKDNDKTPEKHILEGEFK